MHARSATLLFILFVTAALPTADLLRVGHEPGRRIEKRFTFESASALEEVRFLFAGVRVEEAGELEYESTSRLASPAGWPARRAPGADPART